MHSRFESFNDLEYGVRAALINLMNGYIKRGNNEIGTIIQRYAPQFENDTPAYISFLRSWMSGEETIKRENFARFMNGIFRMETGGEFQQKFGSDNAAENFINLINKKHEIWL